MTESGVATISSLLWMTTDHTLPIVSLLGYPWTKNLRMTFHAMPNTRKPTTCNTMHTLNAPSLRINTNSSAFHSLRHTHYPDAAVWVRLFVQTHLISCDLLPFRSQQLERRATKATASQTEELTHVRPAGRRVIQHKSAFQGQTWQIAHITQTPNSSVRSGQFHLSPAAVSNPTK